MNNQQQQGLNIDFKNTTMIEGFDGGLLFGQAFVLRKVLKILYLKKLEKIIKILRYDICRNIYINRIGFSSNLGI
jgi:hypothetical protein